eukprot:3828247-Pyramimonas_sp.AAC.1
MHSPGSEALQNKTQSRRRRSLRSRSVRAKTSAPRGPHGHIHGHEYGGVDDAEKSTNSSSRSES